MFSREKLLAVIFLIVICNFLHCNVKNNDISRKQLFDLNWKFNFGNNISASKVDFNDRNWRNIDLPHDWSKDKELAKSSVENKADSLSTEIGWYRKHFEIPQNWMDKRILIDFEGIENHNEIFVNGTSIDDPVERDTSFESILNPYLNSNGNNVIAVRVAIPKQTDGSWKAESGIYKHVWLIVKDTQDFKD